MASLQPFSKKERKLTIQSPSLREKEHFPREPVSADYPSLTTSFCQTPDFREKRCTPFFASLKKFYDSKIYLSKIN